MRTSVSLASFSIQWRNWICLKQQAEASSQSKAVSLDWLTLSRYFVYYSAHAAVI